MIKTLFAALAFTGSFSTMPESESLKPPELFTSPGINAVYDAKKKAVLISWQQKTSGINIFILQRSDDNFTFTDMVRMEITQFNSNKIWQYADLNPTEGKHYYRLQSISSNGKTEYSSSVWVLSGGSINWIMYPVPVIDLLTLQYKGLEKITGVINIILQTIQGKILTRLRCASNNTVIKIPVNNLGKGVYDIRITIENEMVWNQRFVK